MSPACLPRKEFKLPCSYPANNPAEIEKLMAQGFNVFTMQRATPPVSTRLPPDENCRGVRDRNNRNAAWIVRRTYASGSALRGSMLLQGKM